MNGVVESITTDWRGDALDAAVASSATVLTMGDTSDFDEELGGWLTIADAAPVTYAAVDHDAATVTLSAAVGAAYEAGDPVVVWDPTVPPSGAKVVEYLASVMTDRGALDAVIPHELIPAAGIDTMIGASVTLVEDDGEWYVGQVPGREPLLDASFIDPTTAVPGGQAFSADAPSATDGYPEGYGWWQVDAAGDVVGFWRLVAGVWTPQTIVTAEALVAGNVLVDALTGTTVTGTTVQSRAEQERGIKFGFVSGVEGIFAYDDAGNVFLKAVPAEGMAVVAGEIKANTTTVTEGTSLGGITEITRAPDGTAGAVRLTGYTTAPKSAPTVTTGYDTVQFTDDGLWGDRYGWSTDGAYWYTARYDNNGGFIPEKWSSATGLLVASGGVHQGTVTGMVHHAGKLYTLANHRFNWRVYRNDATTLNYETIGIWPDYDSIEIDPNSPPRDPTIGVDAATGDLLIAQSRNSNNEKVRIRRWTMPATELADLVSVGSAVNSSFGYARDLAGVTYGTHDLGVNRYIFSGNDAYRDYRVIDSSGTTVSAEDWQSGMTGKVGFTYAERTVSVTRTSGSDVVTGGPFYPTDVGSAINPTGFPTGTTVVEYISSSSARLSSAATSSGTTTPLISAFKSIDKNGLMRTYTGQEKNTTIGNANLTKWVSNTLANATLETDQSPRAKITIPKRTKLNVTTSAINTGGANAPDRVKVYVGSGSTSPARTAMWKQTDPAVGVITTAYSSLATSGTNPPATNGFAAAAGTVQRLELADGTVFLDGVGGGTGWTTYNPTWTATTNPVIGNGTITGRYARIGRNTIAFTIVLTVGSTTTIGSGSYDFGLPVAGRSLEEVVVTAIQTGPFRNYVGRCQLSTSTVRLFQTSDFAAASNTNTSLASGSILRIHGTYEAA